MYDVVWPGDTFFFATALISESKAVKQNCAVPAPTALTRCDVTQSSPHADSEKVRGHASNDQSTNHTSNKVAKAYQNALHDGDFGYCQV